MYRVDVSQPLFHSVLLRLTSALPNPLLAVSAAAVPVCAMYWLLERQFRQSELTHFPHFLRGMRMLSVG